MKKSLLGCIALAAAVCICGPAYAQNSGEYQILIVANQNYPFYRQAVHGFMLGLREQEYHEGRVSLEYLRMEAGAEANQQQLQRSMERRSPDLIYVVGAAAADMVAQEVDTIPVVFTGLYKTTDQLEPVEDGAGNNTCGVTVGVPMEKAAHFFRTAYPFETLIVVSSPGDQEGDSQYADLKAAGESLGFSVESLKLGPEKVEDPLESVPDREKIALFIPLDLGVYDSFGLVLAEAEKRKIPVFSMLSEAILRGGHLGFTANFYLAGEMAAFKAGALLRGESSPAELSSHTVPMYDIVINERAAREIDLRFSPETYTPGVEIIR